MKLHEDTIRIQQQFGEFCRTGEEPDLPGVTPGRLHNYRRLVNNVVRDTLDTAFPITVASMDEAGWDRLVQEFFTEGLPQTPQVWKLPFEFYKFHLARKSGSGRGKPYLDDLLHFEWMEIEVHTMPDRPYPGIQPEGDIFTDRLAFNPEFEILRLEYPVHLYPVQESVELKGEYFVLIYRIPGTGHVRFMDLSAINTFIFTQLAEGAVRVDLVKEIAEFTGIESEKYLHDALTKFIRDLMEKELILGFNRD